MACSNGNPNVCPGSMLQNGGFSNGLNGWQMFPANSGLITVASGGSFGQGAQVCNDTQNGVSLSYLFQEFNVTPGAGKEGLVTWNYNRVSGNNSPWVRLYFEDAAGNSLFSQGLNPGFQDDWNTFSFSRAIPDNATKVIVAYGVSQGAPTSTGCVIFDELCFEVLGGSAPTCSLATDVNISGCDNRNTSDPSDDLYDWLVDVTPTNGGTGYTAEWIENGAQRIFDRTYPVGIAQRFNRISNGPFTLTLTDNADPNCTTTVDVVPPAPCSTGGGTGGDLELTATGAPTIINAFANAFVRFGIKNTGNTAVSNIEVELNIADNAILQGGNEFIATQGTLESFWTPTPIWNVGTLQPGQAESIQVNIFSLNDQTIDVYGQVASASGTDPDSTPGNGSCCQANEDDEAVFTFNGNDPPMGTDLRVENVRLRSTPPTIIGEAVSVFFDGIIDGTPLQNSQFPITYALYLSTDNSLSGNDTKILDLNMGFGSGLQLGGQVPMSLTPGNYYLIVQMDVPNNIPETNEFNNWTASAAPISIQSSNPPNDQPDLRLGNLAITNMPNAGQILSYNFDLTNSGDAPASGNFNIKAYISTDNMLSNDDIQDGIVPTGNLGVGTVGGVPGASTLPATLPQGDYWLILKVDADNQITESNENNNTISSQFTTSCICTTDYTSVCGSDGVTYSNACVAECNGVFNYTLGECGSGSSCAFMKDYTPSGFNPFAISNNVFLSENGSEYTINYNFISNSIPTIETTSGTYVLDLEGNVTNANQTIAPLDQPVKIERDGFDLMMVFESTTNPPAGTEVPINYGALPAGAQALVGLNSIPTKTSNGYVFGVGIVDATGMALNRVIQTDNQGNVTRVDEMPTGGFYSGYAQRRVTEGPDGSIFVGYQTSGNNTLFGIPASGASWDFQVLADTPSANWNDTRVSSNGQWVVTSKTDNFNAVYARINVQTGDVQSVDLRTVIYEDAPPGGFRRQWIGSAAANNDGSVLYSVRYQNVIGSDVGFIIGMMDSNGQKVWKQDFSAADFPGIFLKPIGETSDGGYLFGGSEGADKSLFVKTTETGALTPLCGGNTGGNGADLELTLPDFVTSPAQWSNFGTTLTLTNSGTQPATGIEVTFSKANEVVYQGGNETNLSQGTFQHWGDEIWRVGTLAPGTTATLDVNYFRLSANGFSLYAQVSATGEADLDSTPGNGICCTASEDDEASLQIGNAARGVSNRSAVAENLGNELFAIVNAAPNPTTGRFNLEVYSSKNQTSEITVVDILGKPIFRKAIELNEGHNSIPIDLENRGAGMMIVKMTPFYPYLRQIRVMKVRE